MNFGLAIARYQGVEVSATVEMFKARNGASNTNNAGMLVSGCLRLVRFSSNAPHADTPGRFNLMTTSGLLLNETLPCSPP